MLRLTRVFLRKLKEYVCSGINILMREYCEEGAKL
jgi:hypothetical protein